MKLLIFMGLIISCPKAYGSIVDSDTVYVSTIGGQAPSDGIVISSSVYFTSGSSLTLQSAGGYITTSSSISASAFFGGGQNLAGLMILNTTQTLTGANLFISSLTVQSNGRQIVLSTSVSVNNISISSAGAVSFYPELHNSSSTFGLSASTATGVFGPCIQGSTLTITTTGGRVEVSFVGQLGAIIGAGVPSINFLQDGKYVSDLSNTAGIRWLDNTNGGYPGYITASFSYLTEAPSPGSHTYCLTFRSTTPGASPVGTAEIVNDQYRGNIFYVKEIK